MITSYLWYSLVVSACAACIALVVEPMLRAARRPTRWLWAGTFALSLVVPVLVAVRPRVVAPNTLTGGIVLPDAAIVSTAPVATRTLDAWLGMAWVIAALLVGVVLFVGLVQLSRARRRAERGVLAGREVALTADLGPGALPFGEPKILVPRWASSLSSEAARLLVAHEDEHVRAGDARLLVGAALLLVAMPWNVVLWWSLRRLRTAIELDCDARVLRRESSVAPYAELLLQVAGRGRAAPALLALTDSTSQLRTRIDAMTVARGLTPARRALLGALAIGAIVVACEARRPDPVAPVTDYTVKDGRATALAADRQSLDSVKVEIEGSMKTVNPAMLGKPSNDPLVLVHDARGKVVFAGRLDSSRVLSAIRPEEIATVDVVKRGDLLPEEARGGLISVRLKPEASFASPVPGDSSSHYKSPEGAQDVELRETAPVPGVFPDAVFSLIDGSGAAIWEGQVTTKFTDGLGPYKFSTNDISRVEINKAGGNKKIYVYLKTDARVEKR